MLVHIVKEIYSFFYHTEDNIARDLGIKSGGICGIESRVIEDELDRLSTAQPSPQSKEYGK